jgi:hypothetical protein
MKLVALAAAGLWLTPGCSFLFLQRLPADYSEGDQVECTTSPAAPVADTVLTLLHVASLVYLNESYKGSNADSLASLDFSWAIFLGASAIYGFYETHQCEKALRIQSTTYYPHARAPRGPAPYPIRPPIGGAAPPQSAEPLPASPASAAPAPPTTAPTPQQQDDDDPSARRRPRSNQGPMDAPRFGN